jgi:hypothetical protein
MGWLTSTTWWCLLLVAALLGAISAVLMMRRRSDAGTASEPAVAAVTPGPYPGSCLPTGDGSIPDGYPVKGNEATMLYHTDASPFFGRTRADVWFDTEEAADAAGFTRWDEN